MYLKSLSLEGVRGFKNLNFDFERADGTYAGWTVLVGGNASGKSSVLKSIALALMGPDAGRQLLGTPSGWISAGQNRAVACVQIAWDRDRDGFKPQGKPPGTHFTAEVRWQQDKHDSIPVFRAAPLSKNVRTGPPQRGPWNPNAHGWFCSGYGPMRRLTGSSSESMRFSVDRGVVSRFVTLFREDAALSESEAWLKTNHARWLENKSPELKALLDGVQALLSDNLLPQGMKISRLSVDHVFVMDSAGLELPMRDISDGCRSIYATVLDLVHGMFMVYGGNGLFATDESGHVTVEQPGIVLIDEIEAHLHPSWQRDIPEWFKAHFPKIQFFVTTHSPLVAQAADQNGVFLLPSPTDQNTEPRALNDEETARLRLGRAEKTLLGVAFGLKTIRSKWATTQIKKWKTLSAKEKSGTVLNHEEKEELGALREQMQIAFEQPSPEKLQ